MSVFGSISLERVSKSHLTKKNCAAELEGKTVQIEYGLEGYKSYFITFAYKGTFLNLDKTNRIKVILE